MKGFKILITLVLAFFLAFCGTIPVGAEYVIGVKSGDWAKHDVQLGGSVNPMLDCWTKITVEKVEGTVISGTFEEKSSSGLSPPQNFSIDIMQAHSSYVLKDYYFIPANLTAGSVIPALNLTIQRTFINRFGREEVYTEVTSGGYRNVSYSWDRNTGVLMSYCPAAFFYDFHAVHTENTLIELMDTNLWSGGIDMMFWTQVTIPIVIAVAISLGLFFRHKRHKKRLADAYVHGPPGQSTPEPSG